MASVPVVCCCCLVGAPRALMCADKMLPTTRPSRLAALPRRGSRAAPELAILISGDDRGFLLQSLWQTWARHVVAAVQPTHSVATFVCLANGGGAATGQASEELPRQVLDALSVVSVHRDHTATGSERLLSCFTHMLAHESQRQRRFAFVLHGRPDVSWFRHLDVSVLSPGRVSVRARKLVSSVSPSRDACPMRTSACFSWWPADLLQCPGINVSCILVDDQVAAMPRGLADGYFGALKSGMPAASEVDGTAWVWGASSGYGGPGTGCGEQTCNFFMQPLPWTPPARVASFLVGADRQPDGRARTPFCATRNGRRAAVCWSETMHTAILLAHGIPLQQMPFAFHVRAPPASANTTIRGAAVPKYANPPRDAVAVKGVGR